MTLFDKELIEEAIVEVEMDGNLFKCLLCGEWHEVTDDNWQIDEEMFNIPLKAYTCSKNIYYVFYKSEEGIINFMYGLDCIQLQDGELKNED